MLVKEVVKKIVPKKLWFILQKKWNTFRDYVHEWKAITLSQKYQGITLFYDEGSTIMDRLKHEAVFEEEMCRTICDELKKFDKPLFVDIGANLGLISAYVLNHSPEAWVVAVEPGPHQFNYLELSVKENNIQDRMTLFSFALGKEIKKTKFQTHFGRYTSGDGLIDTGRARKSKSIDVEMVTFDYLWNLLGKPKVHVIKIDTEGAELWVLEGAKDFLSKNKPVIFLEIEPKNLKVYPYSHYDILSTLNKLSYQLKTLSGIEINKDNFASYLDSDDTYMAVPI